MKNLEILKIDAKCTTRYFIFFSVNRVEKILMKANIYIYLNETYSDRESENFVGRAVSKNLVEIIWLSGACIY